MAFYQLLTSLPWIVTSAVMLGISLHGWRRTKATGALLIAIAAAIQIVDTFGSAAAMWLTIERGMSMTARYGVYSGVLMLSHLVTTVLGIVGVALLIRRVPSQPKPAQPPA